MAEYKKRVYFILCCKGVLVAFFACIAPPRRWWGWFTHSSPRCTKRGHAPCCCWLQSPPPRRVLHSPALVHCCNFVGGWWNQRGLSGWLHGYQAAGRGGDVLIPPAPLSTAPEDLALYSLVHLLVGFPRVFPWIFGPMRRYLTNVEMKYDENVLYGVCLQSTL